MDKDTGPSWADPDVYGDLAAFDGEWRELWWNSDFLDLMERRWDLGGVRILLDVGCGAGHWGRTLLPVLPSWARVVGLDIESAFLQIARKEARTRGLDERLSFAAGRAEALPYENDSFDCVTCQTLLMHVADAPAVIAEMQRVLRPGGLLVLVEPDNTVLGVSDLNSHPRISITEAGDYLVFQLTCEKGKAALGEGNSSIGGLLPGYVAEAGFERIVVHQTDKCAALWPPYQSRGQQIEAAVSLRWLRSGIYSSCGPRGDALRYFLAGGGTSSEFDRLWEIVRRRGLAVRDAIESGTYHAARGIAMYLVSARKPSKARPGG